MSYYYSKGLTPHSILISLGFHLLFCRLMNSCQRDKYSTQHREYQCLNEANKYLQKHHKDTHSHTHNGHGRTKYNTHSRHDEDNTGQSQCNSMSCHHISKETHHQCKGFCEDSKNLNHWHQRYWHLQPCGYIWPKDILPIMLRTREVGY